jgi:ribose transport system permease protein
MILLFVIMFVSASSFFSYENLTDILLNTATNAIPAFGMLFIILIGQIDNSVGAQLAACCFVTGFLARSNAPMIVILLAAMGTGAILSAINGCLVSFLNLPAIIITLGTMNIYRGLIIFITGGTWITNLPQGFLEVGRGKIIGIPIPVLVMFVVFVIIAFILRYTSFGRNFYAVGSNNNAARLSGLPVRRIKIAAFVVSGLLVGLTAVFYTGHYGNVQSNTGEGFQMIAISAVVVGGASVFGGRGTSVGTLLGALLVTMIGTMLIYFQISAYWEMAVRGLIILLATTTYTIVERRKFGRKLNVTP